MKLKVFILASFLAVPLVAKPKEIKCRAMYLRADLKKPETKGKWQKGYSSCQVLMLGLAVANSNGLDERRVVEIRNATDDQMFDLAFYYKKLKKQLAEPLTRELEKERKL